MLAGLTGVASATIWTVDNSGGLADFSDVNSAIAAVEDGDTLLFAGSSSTYGTVSLTKPLCLIGPGYFLTENPNPYEKKLSAKFQNITLNSGSSGSQLLGLDLLATPAYIVITSAVSNVIVKRCSARYFSISGDNNTIMQSYASAGSAGAIQCSGTNNTIRNNYLNTHLTNMSTINAGNIIENNVIRANMTISSCAFGNNIVRTYDLTFHDCDPYNCICDSDQCGTENDNQANVDMASIFLLSGTSDGQWVLADESPAIGAGLGGIDCGMFGGSAPYVLSGIPDIPQITSIFVPGRANPAEGLDIKVTIKSTN